MSSRQSLQVGDGQRLAKMAIELILNLYLFAKGGKPGFCGKHKSQCDCMICSNMATEKSLNLSKSLGSFLPVPMISMMAFFHCHKPCLPEGFHSQSHSHISQPRVRPSHGTRLNSRELTAILYANPTDWDLQRES